MPHRAKGFLTYPASDSIKLDISRLYDFATSEPENGGFIKSSFIHEQLHQ
jgi:hypothetical protein